MAIYSHYRPQAGVGLANSGTFGGNTVSLSHFDGADAAVTTFDDISGNNWVFAGSAQLDTAQLKFGTASVLFTGDPDAVTNTLDNSLISSDPLTFEYFARFAIGGGVLTECQTAGGDPVIRINIDNSANTLVWQVRDEDGGIIGSGTESIIVADDTQYHVAGVILDTNVQIYFNESRIVNATLTGTKGAAKTIFLNGLTALTNSWVDECRLSKIVRYTGATLTQPTSAFVID